MNFIISIYKRIESILGLSLSLAKANFKIRNEGSYLGILWYLLEPLVFLIVLLTIRQSVVNTNIASYQLYLFIGLIMFNFFNAVTNFSTRVIQNNSGFIKSLRINKEVFVISGLLQFVFSHFFEFLILIIFSLFFEIKFLYLLIFYPILFLFFCFFTVGISFILSIVGVYIKDLSNVWSVFTRLLWLITPIFYTIENNSLLQKINIFNPLYYFINIARDIVIYSKLPNIYWVLLIVFCSVFVFLIGLIFFEKSKKSLAERI